MQPIKSSVRTASTELSYGSRLRGRLALAAAAAAVGLCSASTFAQLSLNPGDIVIGTANQGGERNNSAGGIYLVNPTTGARTLIGTTTSGYGMAQPTSMVWDPVNSRIVVGMSNAGNERASGAGGLYSLNVGTGVRTLLGTTVSGYGAAQPSSVLWDSTSSSIILGTANQGGERSSGQGGLYFVNPTTGARTLIGSTNGGYGAAQPSSLVYDPQNNRVIVGTANQGGERNNNAGGLFTVDLTTGARTILGTTNGGYGAAQPSSMVWDPVNNWLVVGTANQGNERSNGAGGLYTVNPVTGARTVLGTTNSGYGSAQPSAMAWDTTGNRIILGTANQGGERNNSAGGLYFVDPATGARTLVGSTNSGYGSAQVSSILVIPDVLDFTGGNDLTISTGTTSATISGSPNFRSTDSSAVLNVSDFLTQVNTRADGAATARTGSGGANNQQGNLTVAAVLDSNGLNGKTILLRASNDITFNAGATLTDSTGGNDAVNLTLVAKNAKQSAGLTGTTGKVTLGGTINLNGGTLTSSGTGFENTAAVTVGAASLNHTGTTTISAPLSAATATIAGGTLDINADVDATTSATITTATTNLTAGTLTTPTLTVTGASFTQSGGVASVSGTASITSSSSAQFSAGSFSAGTLNSTTPTFTVNGGSVSAGTFNPGTGSTVTVSAGTLAVTTANLSPVDTLTVSGGTLEAGSLNLNQPTRNFNHTGGTIRVTGGTLTPRAGSLNVGGVASPTVELTDGATSSVTAGLTVGSGAAGFVNVLSGSHLTTNLATVSSGTVQVADAGSTWTNTGTLAVGSAGSVQIGSGATVTTAAVSISSGGQIALSGGTLSPSSGQLDLPANALITGNGTVTGRFRGAQDSTLTADGDVLTVGDATSFNGFRTAGDVVVNSGATLEIKDRDLASLGVSTTLNGGTVQAANGVFVAGGNVIAGAGTVLGRVAASVGSTIAAEGGDLEIGDFSNGAGFVTGGEIYTSNRSVTLFDANEAQLGSFTVLGNQTADGRLAAPNGMILTTGSVIQGRGTISADVNNDPFGEPVRNVVLNGSVTGTDGLITIAANAKGNGQFDNVLFTEDFSPGLSPARLVVGNLSLADTSTLTMELGGLTPGSQYDQLVTTKTLSLNGVLQITLINGYVPGAGATFNLFDGTMTGTFDGLGLPTLSSGLTWDTSALYSSGVISVTAIPEPTTLAGLTLGAVGLLSRRRRRSASLARA